MKYQIGHSVRLRSDDLSGKTGHIKECQPGRYGIPFYYEIELDEPHITLGRPIRCIGRSERELLPYWRINRNNDVGNDPENECFVEWYELTDGKRVFKSDSLEDVKWLQEKLNNENRTE